MSYVGGPFQYDVFLSYAHGGELLKQWSAGFAEQLIAELNACKAFKGRISVFFDNHSDPKLSLDKMAPLTDEVRKAASSSAILAVIMTPEYLSSQWCLLERKEWIQSLELKFRELNFPDELSPRHFIAVARSERTNESWPAEFLDPYKEQPIGVLFYDEASNETIVRPYEWPNIDSKTGGVCRSRLVQFAGIITGKLHKIQDLLLQSEEIDTEEIGGVILRDFLDKTGISLYNLNLYLKSTNRSEVKINVEPPADALRSLILLDQLFDAGHLNEFFNEKNIPVIVEKKPDKRTLRKEASRNESSELLSLDEQIRRKIYFNTDEE